MDDEQKKSADDGPQPGDEAAADAAQEADGDQSPAPRNDAADAAQAAGEDAAAAEPGSGANEYLPDEDERTHDDDGGQPPTWTSHEPPTILVIRPDERLRGLTLRAFLTGLVLSAIVAVLTPINVMLLKNPSLFGNYLPAAVVLIVSILAVGVNPLLGYYRFARGELSVILIMLLSLGGVAGQAFMATLPAIMVAPAHTLHSTPNEDSLVYEVADDGSRELKLAERILQHFDRDGDGVIKGPERVVMGPCFDDELVLDKAGLVAAMDRSNEVYMVPHWMTVGLPERGRVESNHPKFIDVVSGYQDGMGTVREDDRAAYGDVTVFESGQGRHKFTLLCGEDRDEALAAGTPVLDPRSNTAAADILWAKVGTIMLWKNAEFQLVAVQQPGIPWDEWWPAFLAWSPLLIGAMMAMIAVAGIVRHQWIVNERLTFPIARVLGSLTAPREDEDGIWQQKGLWVAAWIVFGISLWKTAYAIGWWPIDFKLHLNFKEVMPSEGWLANAPHFQHVSEATIMFTVVAIMFLVTTDVSLSMWVTFLGVNILCGALITNGVSINKGDLQNASVGGVAVFLIVILYIGRRHYWAVARAAVRCCNDPAAKAAAPYVWLMLAGCALMFTFMAAAGVPVVVNLFLIVAMLLMVVVLARVVAESGIPFVSLATGGRVGTIAMLWLGSTVPATALIPLAMIGHVLGNGENERMMPHAVNAHAIDHKVGIGKHKTSTILMTGAIVGLVGAFIGMLIAGYFGGALAGDPWPSRRWNIGELGNLAAGGGQAGIEQRQGDTLQAYLVGGLIVAGLATARLRFTAFVLHPIGFIMLNGWMTRVLWFSYFLGWFAKVLVLRYGGQSLYMKLTPVAVGLILGEAAGVMFRMTLKGVAVMLGYDLQLDGL